MRNYSEEGNINGIVENRIEIFINGLTEDFVAPHIHPAIEIIYFLQGQHDIYVNETHFTASGGDVVMFRSNAVHRMHSTDAAKYCVLKILPEFVSEMAFSDNGTSYMMFFAVTGKTAGHLYKATDEKCAPLREIFNKLVEEYESKKPMYDMAMKIRAMDIILFMLRYSKVKAAWGTDGDYIKAIYDVILYMNENYASDISEKECADLANMSISYFSHRFRAITGRNFCDYLSSIRINRAAAELITNDLPITDVAFKCGFQNVSYFIANFRKVKGVTPLKYRKMSIASGSM